MRAAYFIIISLHLQGNSLPLEKTSLSSPSGEVTSPSPSTGENSLSTEMTSPFSSTEESSPPSEASSPSESTEESSPASVASNIFPSIAESSPNPITTDIPGDGKVEFNGGKYRVSWTIADRMINFDIESQTNGAFVAMGISESEAYPGADLWVAEFNTDNTAKNADYFVESDESIIQDSRNQIMLSRLDVSDAWKKVSIQRPLSTSDSQDVNITSSDKYYFIWFEIETPSFPTSLDDAGIKYGNDEVCFGTDVECNRTSKGSSPVSAGSSPVSETSTPVAKITTDPGEISTTELSTCKNDAECYKTDHYGQEWSGCLGEIVRKQCTGSSNNNNKASWVCSYNGQFATENPDYSQCTNDWLEAIKNDLKETEIVSEEKAIDWIQTLDNITELAFEKSLPYYFGHEIKTMCSIGEDLFRKLDTNLSLSVLQNLTTTTAHILHRILINPNPWKDINTAILLAYRSTIGTSYLRTIQISALTLNNQMTGESLYQISNFKELRVSTLRVVVNSNNLSLPLVYPAFPSANESYIEIPPSWSSNFPIQKTVGFVGIHISNPYAKLLLPVVQDIGTENYQILGEEITFTFEGNQEIQFINEGAKIHFIHDKAFTKSNRPLRRFPIPEASNSSEVIKKCVYWDFKKNAWSGKGCKLRESSETQSTCECQHLSSFAVLFDVHNIVSDEKPLEIISWTLSSISIACLLITVYVYSQTYVKSDRSPRRSITQHLALSLFVAHIGLLLSISIGYDVYDIPYTDNISPTVKFCSSLGAITHYAFLCAFAWMGWEGWVLYKAVFIVFETIREPKWIQFSITYGAPALIVLITGIVGIIRKENPYHSLTEKDCWLSNSYIWAFIGPATIIILVNFTLLILSVRKAHQLAHNPKLDLNQANKQAFGTMVTGSFSLSIILGLTWIFGYLVLINEKSVALPSAYIFTFFNASQGIFIFIFHVATNKSVRKHVDRQLDKLNM